MEHKNNSSAEDILASTVREEQKLKEEERYKGIVEQIVEFWAVGKPVNPSPGSTSTKPSGYYRLTNYLFEYLCLYSAFPRGVHTIPEGRDRFNNVESSFPVDFDTIIDESMLLN
jgi:hypothetical protein